MSSVNPTRHPAADIAAGLGGEPSWRRHLVPALVALVAAIALGAAASATPAFFTPQNLMTIVRAGSMIGIAALGVTFVTISGNLFPLSVSQTAMFTAVTFAAALKSGWGLIPSLLAALLVALVLGLIQGGIVALGANPIVTTIGAAAVLYGAAALLSNNRGIQIGSSVATWLGRARPLGIPTQSWALIILTIAASIVLTKTRFGRLITLSGANRQAAEASGLRTRLATLSAFAIASLTAGMVGVFQAAQIGEARLDFFSDLNMDVIAAVLIAGTRIGGGDGSMVRTTIGTMCIAFLANYLLVSGQTYTLRIFLTGLAVMLGVTIYHLLRERSR